MVLMFCFQSSSRIHQTLSWYLLTTSGGMKFPGTIRPFSHQTWRLRPYDVEPPLHEIFEGIFPRRSSPDPVVHHSEVLSKPSCPDDREISLEDWDAAGSHREIPTWWTELLHPDITSVSPAGRIPNSRGNLAMLLWILIIIYGLTKIGKWHLGYCHPSYLPNNRGFDSYFGSWSHVVNYYTR